jgi:hypothetical protein
MTVYDHLPMKTTHHKVPILWSERYFADAAFELFDTGDYWTIGDVHVPKPSLNLVHTTISGIAVLRVSRTIASEAGAILHPKLTALRAVPIQIIASTLAIGVPEIFELLRLASGSDSRTSTVTRKFLPGLHVDEHPDNPLKTPHPEWQEVRIAVYNVFNDIQPATLSKTRKRMFVLDNEYDDLQWEMENYYLSPTNATRNLRISIQMAGLCLEEKAVAQTMLSMDKVFENRSTHDAPKLDMAGAAEIESEEWAEIWAEGERLLTATAITKGYRRLHR